MPILAAEAPPNPWAQAIFAAACLGVALGLGFALRLIRPRRVDSPDRVPPGASVWPLVGVLGAGLFVWFAVPATYFSYKQAALVAKEGPQAKIDPAKLSPAELAFAATVPPAAGLLALLIGDLAVRRAFRIDLGFGARDLGRGLLYGLLGSLCVVPLLYGFMILVEWAYRAVGYQHPGEHDLLRALGESGEPLTNAALIAGATLMAPLFEELLFRGHLQTAVRRALSVASVRPSVSAPTPPPLALPAEIAPASQGPAPGPPPAAGVAVYHPTVPDAPVVPPAWATWLAIVGTSALFALVHPAWTWPPIFLLSLCLGYAYERTGNLWVPVVIHAAFNSSSTAFYLLLGGGAN